MSVLPLGRRHLPESSQRGDVVVRGKDYSMEFRHVSDGRRLTFSMSGFSGSLPIQGEILLTQEPEESIVMCTPFRQKAHFYYNQKINCLRAEGLGHGALTAL